MKEFEIRPQQLFEEYLEISTNDIGIFFSEHEKFVDIPCPACKSELSNHAFDKHSFQYRQCDQCDTLFVSPRPTNEMIDDFYINSESSKFWADRFFPETAAARREMIFKPRVKMVEAILDRIEVPSPISIVDVGAGYGIFLEEIQKNPRFDSVTAIEPSVDLANTCREKNITVIEKPVEEVLAQEIQASIACSFEVFEHLFNPEKFISHMAGLLKPRGILVFTTLTISGFDLQVLWNKSKSISPPHHINFLSVEGLEILVNRCGLEIVEISTPGKLDVDIVQNMMEEDSEIEIPRFLEYMFKQRSEADLEALQSYLQANKLSSHVMVIARKK
jgi:SAM-dependent methyltransferase